MSMQLISENNYELPHLQEHHHEQARHGLTYTPIYVSREWTDNTSHEFPNMHTARFDLIYMHLLRGIAYRILQISVNMTKFCYVAAVKYSSKTIRDYPIII